MCLGYYTKVYILFSSIRPLISSFHIIDKSPVHHFVAARRGIIAGEIPVALVIGNSLMQVFNALVNHGDLSFHFRRSNELRNFIRDLLLRERLFHSF